ncbi:MAG: hypothetical protein IPM53_25545 [Anaerolineaceae bacterium]|nr:hypothetical protein [Anaerolineaceae bacterium]
MSEREGYVPPEARQETEAKEKLDKPQLSPETVSNIQHGPPESKHFSQGANTEISHFLDVEGIPINHERKPRQVNPEKQPEIEPGLHGKPITRDDPTKTCGDSINVPVTDDPAAEDTATNEEDS